MTRARGMGGQLASVGALAALLLLAGCGLRRQAGLVLGPTTSLIRGSVNRSGVDAPGQRVKLYDPAETVAADSVFTGPDGRYGFERAPLGTWLVKASSHLPGELGYVRYEITRTSAGQRDSIPPFDLSAHGCAALAPASGDTLPAPTPGASLDFRWSAMTLPGTIRYKARLTTPLDSLVWESTRDLGTSASFNGIATSGPLAGQLVPPGLYLWRIKIRFANGVQAATVAESLVFVAPAGASR